MYNVTTNKLNVLTRLGIFNNSADIDLDQYVGSVYSMHSMNNTDHQTKFFKAVNCTELHPNASDSMKSQYEGYKCPDLDSYLLQGNEGNSYQGLADYKMHSFHFEVKSCREMNLIRKQQFNEDEIDCVDESKLREMLDQVLVGVMTTNEFFDLDYYNDPNEADFSVTRSYTETSLDKQHGTRKMYYVEQQKTFIHNSYIYDAPLAKG